MSLSDPVKVDMSGQADSKPSKTTSLSKFNKPAMDLASADGEVFALPQSLKHHFVIVPHKLRLVTLAAFLLQHCKVRNENAFGKALGIAKCDKYVNE